MNPWTQNNASENWKNASKRSTDTLQSFRLMPALSRDGFGLNLSLTDSRVQSERRTSNLHAKRPTVMIESYSYVLTIKPRSLENLPMNTAIQKKPKENE